MILDLTKDPNAAIRYQVIDLDTGEELNVLYADTEKGIYKHWKMMSTSLGKVPVAVETHCRIGIWDRNKLMYVD
jgi:hypothetical protein